MLINKIDDDLKKALKAKDVVTVSTLRFLKSAMQNLAIEKKQTLKDEDVISVIKKQIKQRKDSIEGFKKGARADLVEKEESELKILNEYLPKGLSQEELAGLVKECLALSNAACLKDMGNVIKLVMAKAKGLADGSAVSALVKEELVKRCGQ